MSTRERPPQRRRAMALAFEHEGQRYRAHVGYFPDGRAAELFLNAAKQNSALDAFASDSAILITLLLQRGSSFAEIGHALRRGPTGAPASLIGAAVDQLRLLHDGAP